MLSLFKKSLNKLMVYSEDKLKKEYEQEEQRIQSEHVQKEEEEKKLGHMNLLSWYRGLMYYSNQLLHRSSSTLTSLLQK